MKEKAEAIKAANMRIFVRRGGPNYQAGLALMRQMGQDTGIPVEVFGPETSMTVICAKAIDVCEGPAVMDKFQITSPGELRREAAAPEGLRHKSFSPRPNEACVYRRLYCISYSVIVSSTLVDLAHVQHADMLTSNQIKHLNCEPL